MRAARWPHAAAPAGCASAHARKHKEGAEEVANDTKRQEIIIMADDALLARHPSFASFPSGHGFYVAKMSLDGIWLIDFFGGAAIIKPSDYFGA